MFQKLISDIGKLVSEMGIASFCNSIKTHSSLIHSCIDAYRNFDLNEAILKNHLPSQLHKNQHTEMTFTLYRDDIKNFCILLSFWELSATSIHNHNFSGCYFNLEGESIIANFKNNLEIDNISFLPQDLVGFLEETPHQVAHISKKTTTLIIREIIPHKTYQSCYSLSAKSFQTNLEPDIKPIFYFLNNNMPMDALKYFQSLEQQSQFYFASVYCAFASNFEEFKNIDMFIEQRNYILLNTWFKILDTEESRKFLFLLYHSKNKKDFITNLEKYLKSINVEKNMHQLIKVIFKNQNHFDDQEFIDFSKNYSTNTFENTSFIGKMLEKFEIIKKILY